MANDRCRQMVEDGREEKENIANQHKKDINNLKVNLLDQKQPIIVKTLTFSDFILM